MSDKIPVVQGVDAAGHPTYGVYEYSLADLAKRLGIPEDRFAIKKVDEKLIRQERFRELNRRVNTPEALCRRTNINPYTGQPIE